MGYSILAAKRMHPHIVPTALIDEVVADFRARHGDPGEVSAQRDVVQSIGIDPGGMAIEGEPRMDFGEVHGVGLSVACIDFGAAMALLDRSFAKRREGSWVKVYGFPGILVLPRETATAVRAWLTENEHEAGLRYARFEAERGMLLKGVRG